MSNATIHIAQGRNSQPSSSAAASAEAVRYELRTVTYFARKKSRTRICKSGPLFMCVSPRSSKCSNIASQRGAAVRLGRSGGGVGLAGAAGIRDNPDEDQGHSGSSAEVHAADFQRRYWRK